MSRTARFVCTVDMGTDDGVWWAHCDACRFTAVADTIPALRRLAKRGHRLPYRWNLIGHAPDTTSATSTSGSVTVVWAEAR